MVPFPGLALRFLLRFALVLDDIGDELLPRNARFWGLLLERPKRNHVPRAMHMNISIAQ